MFIKLTFAVSVANKGKGQSCFITFDLARVLHYLLALQPAPNSKKNKSGFGSRLIFNDRKVRMDTMKKTLALLFCMLVLALGATAQEQLNFSGFPLVGTPTLIPNGYGQLNWSNFFYVDPARWSGAGPGYKLGPDRGDVAFIGGKSCIYEYRKGQALLPEACYGTITSEGGPTGFQAVSAMAAGGFGPTVVTVTAYNNGKYVGSSVYNLTTEPQSLSFPASWESITQMVIQTNAGGDFVMFNLSVYFLGG